MMLTSLSKFVENAWVNLMTGMVLLTTSAFEIVRTLEEATVGAHHGIGVFAVVQIFKALPHVVHGAEGIAKFRS